MSLNAAAEIWKLSFQLSPIILTNGIAQLIPGQMLPIISITEAVNFTLGLLSGSDVLDTDNFFASFAPMAGGKIVNNAIGEYPFANQAVAANAIIAQPLTISMLMTCPAKAPGGFAGKLATMTALKAALDQHNNSGGTYTVATPSYFYTNCVMTGMTDVSTSQQQPQSKWQIDFRRPLLTLEQADVALNSMMSQIGGGTPTTGALSGLLSNIGSTLGLAGAVGQPAATSLAGANIGFPD